MTSHACTLCDATSPRDAQSPWGEECTFPVARELFGSNLLVLTWIKGEPLPGDLVADVLRALGLQLTTLQERENVQPVPRARAPLSKRMDSARGHQYDDLGDDDDGDL